MQQPSLTTDTAKETLGGYRIPVLREVANPVPFPAASDPCISDDACPGCHNPAFECLCDGGAS